MIKSTKQGNQLFVSDSLSMDNILTTTVHNNLHRH